MYRDANVKKSELDDYYLPLGGHLYEENRWLIFSKRIPWGEFENDYKKKLTGYEFGSPAKSLRIALGVLIIKEKL